MASGITLACAVLLAVLVVSEASFGGHEHVHIRVHIPHLINEVHHQKKIIHHTIEHDHHDDHHHEDHHEHHHHHEHYDHHGFDDLGGGDFGGGDFGGYEHHHGYH
ncbi:uncharacterized protein [Periplaneta americana]|uniref:uncharacterized protein n=1 Tax=Periplaneta americana TaxID=6978 RepID=UPI0037E784D2